MWDVHIEPLTLLDTLVQLLGSNITTHVTQLSSPALQYNVSNSIANSLVASYMAPYGKFTSIITEKLLELR
jgi:hypothetical protein